MLNTGKGPAVRALRAQADKHAYHRSMKETIEKQPNLDLRQATVDQLIVEDGVCKGVITNTGARYHAKTVVLTVGTAARGKIIIGELQYESGPNNSKSAVKLSENLESLGFDLERFKTGTPPRINGNTIHYDETEEQPGDKAVHHFSFDTPDDHYLSLSEQISCWLTYTNPGTHKLIRDNLDRAPMFSGVIKGVGPRYCPSIEDKIVRFADKSRHQIFLEPEGRDTDEWYVDGLSTSMPEEIQQKILHSVKGLEDAQLMRPGYAIEYDVVAPYQLHPTLETKLVKNLYTAGQTNGTSGYEEAAGQGLIAGINAGLRALGKKPFVLKRSDAYIGVMIDDLVTKGTKEPYRLLTSRAEYRLILRHDNADFRLMGKGHEIGLVSDERYAKMQKKEEQVQNEIARLKNEKLKPNNDEVNQFIEAHGDNRLKDAITAADFIKRPYVDYETLMKFIPAPAEKLDRHVIEQVEIQLKYAGYIKKEEEKVARLKRMEAKRIPANIDYEKIDGLATEGRQKLEKIRPETLAQASRISGVNPADIAILSVYIRK